MASQINFSFFLICLVLLLSSTILASGQSHCNINLGSFLSARGNSPSWTSPSGEFAFGFRPFQRSSSDNEDKNLFLLAIWFDKIPERTILWSKNEYPVPEGSELQLTNEGQLILNNAEGIQVWTAELGNERSTCASMLDSGNFVLMNRDSRYVWESFNVPTDTILPGQRLIMNGKLTSRHSEADLKDGRFQLHMQGDGSLALYTIFLPTEFINGAYWTSATIRASSSRSQLIFDEAGYMYIESGNENVRNITTRDMGARRDFYHMARIDYDGVFRHYNHPRTNYAEDVRGCSSAWSIVQTTPEDMCRAIRQYHGSGACGYNSYCVNKDGRPKCYCPEGYSPLDPLIMDRGCKPDFPLPTCQPNGWESNIDFVEFKELNNTDFPLNDYELQSGIEVDKDTCQEFCLRDCFCVAAVYNGNRCWKKKFPLSNGRQFGSLNRTALIKVPRGNMTSFLCPKRNDQSTLVLVVSVLLGGSVFLNFLLMLTILLAVLFLYRKNLLKLLSAPTTTCGMTRYTYKELEEATGGFKQKLGRGSFGTVYKGVLKSIPRRYTAIKRLDKSQQDGEKEFTTEVNAIGRTHHKNLVTLLGYCDEGKHRLLVYEYMSHGSLASYLFGISRPHWNQRVQIAFGTARGLTYLHEECSTQIIHCDVKPQNILLDEYFTPKISDFGLAKLLLSEQSRAARTHIRGTIGYFAPEWFRKASITVKIDVYSFGVMLLEIICCKSSVEFGLKEEEEALIDYAYDCYSQKKLKKLVENDEEARNDMKRVERVVMVALWCIQEDPSLRPSMRKITQMLEGVTDVSIPPRPSFFSSSS